MATKVATALARGSAEVAGRALAAAVTEQVGTPALAVVFASTAQPLEALMRAVTSALPGTVVVGASTAGEFTENEEANASLRLLAMAPRRR